MVKGHPLTNHYCFFSQTQELQSSKATVTSLFFAADNHNYDHKQRLLKDRNTIKWIEIHQSQSQSMTFWTR